MDMLLETQTDIYVFEFKVNKTAQEALNQIESRSYPAQFKCDKRSLTLIGANFDTKSRRLTDWMNKSVPSMPNMG